MARRLDAEHVVIEKASHSPNMEQPGPLAAVLADFWTATATATGAPDREPATATATGAPDREPATGTGVRDREPVTASR
jgi:hypothetical protein